MADRYRFVKKQGVKHLLHRVIASQILGRAIRPDEHVHHRNGDGFDNRPENLEVLPAAEHQRIHADERLVHARDKVCQTCGAVFTPHRTKRARAKTCSKPCADKLRSVTEKATKARAIVEANYGERQALRRAA